MIKAISLFNFYATCEAKSLSSVPLGPLYLASVLEKAGSKVDFHDYQLHAVEHPNHPDSIRKFLELAESNIIAISCVDQLLPSILIATRDLKKNSPLKKIILGGMGPTGVSDLIVQRFPHVTAVVKGAGEDALPKIVRQIEDPASLRKIPGVCFPQNDFPMHIANTFAELPPIDSIPWPAYEKIDLNQYSRVQLVSSRGCPYQCSFCSVPGLWGHKCTFRKVDQFVKEVEFLQLKKGVKRIHIIDDTFTLSRHRILNFCKAIRETCPKLKWTCYGRLNAMDKELCEEMASAGCDTVYFGVESGSDRVLEKIGKKFNTDVAIDALKIARKYFHIVASFLWGLPYETFEDFGQTIILMHHLTQICPSIEVQLYFVAPLALSDLRKTYNDRIRFSPEYYSFFTWGEESMEFYGEEVLKIIKENMDMFPGMCYFESNDLARKVDLARKLRLI